ncbi:hypothetical protein [Streptomyces sp. UNOB3_S3]|uniref:hypothetical protein n=1 Tax=Streptomyces sp. UNOB3_S3 TaxID=2871682 RepID=UPI001E47422C|nr:hypothetical protein [Streptomyces sp. UNOB3_S3]MCC3775248.1 hypothetical protein [Streptomyces sp. UNOB3_S3]
MSNPGCITRALRKDRRAAAVNAAVGVVLATAAAVLLLFTVPAKHAEGRDFRAAPTCPAAAAPAGDCLRPEPFTVVKVVRDEMKKTPTTTCASPDATARARSSSCGGRARSSASSRPVTR